MHVRQALGGRLVLKTLKSGPALLTEAGQAVLPYCQQLVEVAVEACKAMQDFRLASTGVVSLGASQTVGTYLMPRLIAAFKKNNPEVPSHNNSSKQPRSSDRCSTLLAECCFILAQTVAWTLY